MDREQLVERADRVVFRKLSSSGGGVLLNVDSAAYHGVNELGAVVWEQLAGTMSVAELLAQVEAELDDPPVTWRAEMTSFLDDLVDRGLVTALSPAEQQPGRS